MINNKREQITSTFCLLCVNLVCYWKGIRVIFYIFLTPHLLWEGKEKDRDPQQRRNLTHHQHALPLLINDGDGFDQQDGVQGS